MLSFRKGGGGLGWDGRSHRDKGPAPPPGGVLKVWAAEKEGSQEGDVWETEAQGQEAEDKVTSQEPPPSPPTAST